MNKFLITTALDPSLLGCGTVLLSAEKDLKCSTHRRNRHISSQKNCVSKNGKVNACPLRATHDVGITIVKSDEGTPQVKVNVEKFVDETALPS